MPPNPRVSVQAQDFDAGAEVAALHAGDGGVGAVVSFLGTVRSLPHAPIESMALEHYPGMTERSIEAMVDAAIQRFRLRAVRVVHRFGPLRPGDQIVLVAVAAEHRRAAFEGCEFLMDYLKTQAPFWKQETPVGGTARWVDARDADDAALARWGVDAAPNAPARQGADQP